MTGGCARCIILAILGLTPLSGSASLLKVSMSIVMTPIGWVHNGITEMVAPEVVRREESLVELLPEYRPALEGIAEGDRVLVLFYFHRVAREGFDLRLHPRGDLSLAKRGLFATRTQRRPNPIGATVARVVRIVEAGLLMRGLDALDGSPVLDLKRYSAAFDAGLMDDEPWREMGERG